METGIQPSYILGADEAIVLAAVEEFDDVVEGKKVHRLPGQCWMIIGPTEYIPPVDVKVVETRCGGVARAGRGLCTALHFGTRKNSAVWWDGWPVQDGHCVRQPASLAPKYTIHCSLPL